MCWGSLTSIQSQRTLSSHRQVQKAKSSRTALSVKITHCFLWHVNVRICSYLACHKKALCQSKTIPSFVNHTVQSCQVMPHELQTSHLSSCLFLMSPLLTSYSYASQTASNFGVINSLACAAGQWVSKATQGVYFGQQGFEASAPSVMHRLQPEKLYRAVACMPNGGLMRHVWQNLNAAVL